VNPALISRRNTSARILLTGAAAALASVTALTGGPAGAAAAHRAGSTAAPSGTIMTIAGGVGGPAKATTVALTALGVASHGGRLYVADGPAVRRIAANDQLTTPVGSGAGAGAADSGGLATESSLVSDAVATDGAGNLVIAEHNHRQVSVAAAKTGTFFGRSMTAGHISPVAGGGQTVGGDSGLATEASIAFPRDVAVDSAGDLAIADNGNQRAASCRPPRARSMARP
jgi:NHL repeat